MKSIIGAFIVGGTLLVIAFVLTRAADGQPTPLPDGSNVSVLDGVQIIAIDAKGGYTPRKSLAKAGIETVIRFNTNATFDCSAAVRIPSLDISQTLIPSGSTDIPIGTPEPGLRKGLCGMGMYTFEVLFE